MVSDAVAKKCLRDEVRCVDLANSDSTKQSEVIISLEAVMEGGPRFLR